MKKTGSRSAATLFAVLSCLWSTTYSATAGAAVEVAALNEATVAVVDGTEINAAEYDATFALAARQKYYHRQPPEENLMQFRREVADSLVNRILLLREADQRGVQPDADKIATTLAAYDRNYKDSEQWREKREQMLPLLRDRLEQQSRLEQLEKNVRDTGTPSEAELRAYYEGHAPLFTQPDRVRVALILLKVDPSSPGAVWEQAREEAVGIRARIAKGADFDALARLHSADPSADKGGDLGYLHRGMMPAAVHEEVDKLQDGMVSEPITLLEGVALMKVIDRAPSRLMPFDEVRERVTDLWRRTNADRRWTEFITQLRAHATILVSKSRFPDYLTATASVSGK